MVNLLMTLSRKVELGDIINLQVLRLEQFNRKIRLRLCV